jgi:hypothetical protein
MYGARSFWVLVFLKSLGDSHVRPGLGAAIFIMLADHPSDLGALPIAEILRS